MVWLMVQEKRVGRQGDWSSVKLQEVCPPTAHVTKRIRECAGFWVCWVLAGYLSWGRSACFILGVGEGLGEGFNRNRAFLSKAELNWLMKLPRLFLTTASKLCLCGHSCLGVGERSGVQAACGHWIYRNRYHLLSAC